MSVSEYVPAAGTVTIAPTADDAGAKAGDLAAHLVRTAIDENGGARVVFASAPSQEGMLAALGAAEGIDWSKVTSMHLDDYRGIEANHPAGFGRWLADRLPEQAQAGLTRMRTDGEAEAEIDRYTRVLNAGRIDLVCLGIGVNGHLAFNEPGDTDFDDSASVRQVELTRTSRRQQVDEGLFSDLDHVPTHALSLTVPAIMRGKAMVCTVLGAAKAASSVAAALTAPVSTDLPASVLRTHPQAFMFLDPGAAGKLPRGNHTVGPGRGLM